MLDTLERPKTLKENALEQLREAITMGYFKPGERLVERVLCEKLGVSRSVIRECIRHLESEQLITTRPNAGPSVAVLDINEAQEIYDIRVKLEVAAVRSCAIKASDVAIVKLKQDCENIATSLEAGQVLEALRQTTGFYQTIFSEGENRVAWGLVKQLNARVSRLRAITLDSKQRTVSGPEHLRRIVAAIEARDPVTAAIACRCHISEAAQIALAQISNQDKESA